MKPKIQTPWSHTVQKEKGGGKSLTIPDQTMSISEILQRYVRGQSLGGHADEGQYYEDDDARDLDRMELTDRMEYIAQRGKEYRDLKQKQQDEAENEYKRKIIEEHEKTKAPVTPA